MKRFGNLMEKIADIGNLESAFWKAQKDKTGKPQVETFRKNLFENMNAMHDGFLNGTLRLGNYHYFTIHDPKERMICAAEFRERVIHHAVINICEPIFESFQIYDSYACRKGKGMDSCLKRAREFCGKYPWYLKLDIHKYFDSIDHGVLRTLLSRRFKDPDLLALFSDLLDTYEVTSGCGIPIGNLASQYFANFYLGYLDHQFKDRWHVPGYLRYMDDCILFADSKQQLMQYRQLTENYLNKTLKLTLNSPVINRTAHGIPFLSYIVYGDKLRLSLKAKRRFAKKITSANRMEDRTTALSLLAFINRADSSGFREKIFYGTASIGARTA